MPRPSPALAALAAVLVLAGCGGAGEEPTSETEQASIDPALLECGDPENADPTLQLSPVDLTQATWTMPDGFAETFAYSEDLPVEHIASFWVAEPTEEPVPLNVLTVVVYSDLDWGEQVDECGRVPISAVDERLEGYNDANGAEPLGEVSTTEVAGLPALQQDLGLPEYSYRGYWVFSRDQMLHLYCQWTAQEHQEQILSGCEELLASVEVPGA